MHFLHLTLRVADIDRSLAFYRDFVGLTVEHEERTDQWAIAFLSEQKGGTQIELVQIAGDSPAQASGLTVCFECKDAKNLHELAQAKNLNPSPIRQPDRSMLYFYVYDPDGISIEFKELNDHHWSRQNV